MEEKIVVVFWDLKHGYQEDLEIPLDISAHDLFIALNQSYQLQENTDDFSRCYLKCENPIALLKGNKSLKTYRLHNGSRILYTG